MYIKGIQGWVSVDTLVWNPWSNLNRYLIDTSITLNHYDQHLSWQLIRSQQNFTDMPSSVHQLTADQASIKALIECQLSLNQDVNFHISISIETWIECQTRVSIGTWLCKSSTLTLSEKMGPAIYQFRLKERFCLHGLRKILAYITSSDYFYLYHTYYDSPKIAKNSICPTKQDAIKIKRTFSWPCCVQPL